MSKVFPYLGIGIRLLGANRNIENAIVIIDKSVKKTFICKIWIPCLLLKSFILGTKVKRIFETIKFIMVHKAKK